MAETKHNPENGEFPSHGYPNLADLPEGFEVVIRRTRSGLESSVGSAMQSGDSAMDVQRKLMRPLETKHEPKASGREPEAVEEKTDHEHEPEEETVLESKRKKKKGKKKKTDFEVLAGVGRHVSNQWKNLDAFPYSKPIKAGLIGASAAAVPAAYYGSGLAALGVPAAATALVAVALPLLGYWAGSKEGKGTQGLIGGASAGAGLYYLGGSTLSAIGTALGSVALPVGLGYIGYKIGKKYKLPVVGSLAGSAVGILAAPAASGALSAATGGGYAALGGALAGIGSTAGIAAGVGLGAAGLYGLGKLNKKIGKLTFKNDNLLTTMGEGFLLPISAAWKGGEWLASKVRRKRPPEPEEATPEPAPTAQSTTKYNNEPALTPEVQKSIEYWEDKL